MLVNRTALWAGIKQSKTYFQDSPPKLSSHLCFLLLLCSWFIFIFGIESPEYEPEPWRKLIQAQIPTLHTASSKNSNKVFCWSKIISLKLEFMNEISQVKNVLKNQGMCACFYQNFIEI